MLITRSTCTALLVLALCGSLPSRLAAAAFDGVAADAIGAEINQIQISGNARTRSEYILKWTGLRPGLELSTALLMTAHQALLDKGLFREIRFETESGTDDGVVLHLIVEEKRYTLLVPRLSRNGDGDIKAGIRLRMHNLQGADQTLEVLAQQEEQSSGNDSTEWRIGYTLPLYVKPYELVWQARHEIANTAVEGFTNVETRKALSMGVARDWAIDALRIPLILETGITFEQVDLERPYPDVLQAIRAGRFNRLLLELRYDGVHYERYRRFGSRYSVTLEQGFEWLDSDYESTILTFDARGFRPLNRYDNINYRLVLNVANDSPFDYLSYGIGDASTLRGLQDFDQRGDARIFTNLEYVFAYRSNPGLQHTLFIDIGNVYRNLKDVNLGDLHYTVGTGFRWQIESFVKTHLFLDYGYDFDADEGRLYGGTSLNF